MRRRRRWRNSSRRGRSNWNSSCSYGSLRGMQLTWVGWWWGACLCVFTVCLLWVRSWGIFGSKTLMLFSWTKSRSYNKRSSIQTFTLLALSVHIRGVCVWPLKIFCASLRSSQTWSRGTRSWRVKLMILTPRTWRWPSSGCSTTPTKLWPWTTSPSTSSTRGRSCCSTSMKSRPLVSTPPHPGLEVCIFTSLTVLLRFSRHLNVSHPQISILVHMAAFSSVDTVRKTWTLFLFRKCFKSIIDCVCYYKCTVIYKIRFSIQNSKWMTVVSALHTDFSFIQVI